MTVSIPSVTFPGTGTSRELTGRPVTSGLVLIMSRPATTAPGYGRQPSAPRWPGDRSGLWLRNAAAGLCLLAAAAATVSFTAQYRMVDATRHLPVVAALEAAIPDAAALVFACLGIALALHGRRAIRARALNLASVGASVFMNAIAAAPGWWNLAIWAMPPIAYALASDTLIGVVRARALARHRQQAATLAGEEAGSALPGRPNESGRHPRSAVVANPRLGARCTSQHSKRAHDRARGRARGRAYGRADIRARSRADDSARVRTPHQIPRTLANGAKTAA